jgi:hypothetical protein
MTTSTKKKNSQPPSPDCNLETDYEAFQLYFQFRELILAEMAAANISARDVSVLLDMNEQQVSHVLSGGMHNRSGAGIRTNTHKWARLAELFGKRFKVELVDIPPRHG